MKKIIMALSLLALTGCASLSEKECKHGNWAAIGQRDGERGMSKDRIDSHSKACAEYGITPDSTQYSTGFTSGNKSYCSQKGMTDGKAGSDKGKPRTCNGVSTYTAGYKEGFKEYCHAQGVMAGTHADKKKGAVSCQRKREFSKGFAEGLKSYCTDENGYSKGQTAQDHRANYCPRTLRNIFNVGYKRGIEEYCQRTNGFNIGKDGGNYKPTKCPRLLRGGFTTAYNKGKEYKLLGEQINVINDKLSELDKKVQDPATSTDLKAYLSKEMNDKESQKKDLEVKKIKIEGYIGV
jgi:hypothetical protein